MDTSFQINAFTIANISRVTLSCWETKRFFLQSSATSGAFKTRNHKVKCANIWK